jgi:hypothetical protein
LTPKARGGARLTPARWRLIVIRVDEIEQLPERVGG